MSRNESRPLGRSDRTHLTRRGFFSRVGDGLHGAALAYLLGQDLVSPSAALAESTERRIYDLKARDPHFEPKAKSVIHFFMNGGTEPSRSIRSKAGAAKVRRSATRTGYCERHRVHQRSRRVHALAVYVCQAWPVGCRNIGDPAPPGRARGRHRVHPLNVHHALQPRAPPSSSCRVGGSSPIVPRSALGSYTASGRRTRICPHT